MRRAAARVSLKVVRRTRAAGSSAGEAGGAVEGDDGLAGAGAAGDAGGAGEVAGHEVALGGVEEDGPGSPRGRRGRPGARRSSTSRRKRRWASGWAKGSGGAARRGGGLDAGGEVDQRLEGLGREVVGEVEQGVLGRRRGRRRASPGGRRRARRVGVRGAGEEAGLRAARTGARDDDLLDPLADLDELGGAGRGVGLEAAALGPGVGGVVVADPGEQEVGAALVEDDAEVAVDADGPEVAVAGAVDAVELQAGGGGVDLEVEGGVLTRLRSWGVRRARLAVKVPAMRRVIAGRLREPVVRNQRGVAHARIPCKSMLSGHVSSITCRYIGSHIEHLHHLVAEVVDRPSRRYGRTSGCGKGREMVALRLSQASSSISAFRVVFSAL